MYDTKIHNRDSSISSSHLGYIAEFLLSSSDLYNPM